MSGKKVETNKSTSSNPTILSETVIYIPCSYIIYKTVAEIAQNDFIVRHPERTELIMEEFSKLFVTINDHEN
jgi:hypothetical protein